jgi:hypothetical protein
MKGILKNLFNFLSPKTEKLSPPSLFTNPNRRHPFPPQIQSGRHDVKLTVGGAMSLLLRTTKLDPDLLWFHVLGSCCVLILDGVVSAAFSW